MSTFGEHENVLRDTYYGNRFIGYDDFEPLSAHEFRNMTCEDLILSLDNERLERMWIKPIQRRLQEEFRIDQRSYSASTDPTLAELTEDFKIATAITVDFLFANQEEVLGQQSVSGVGSRNWSNAIPSRARSLLERYSRRGGQIGRA